MESLEALSQALLTVYRKVYSKAVFYTVENFYLILLFDLWEVGGDYVRLCKLAVNEKFMEYD